MGPKPLRFRVTVSPSAHPVLYGKLAGLPTDARPQELVALADGVGADPRLLAILDRIASALEAGGGIAHGAPGAGSGPMPADVAAPELPPGLDKEEWA